jgi:hypothetical protein
MTAMPHISREVLGRIVRETWTAWAAEQPDPKPSWLTPWGPDLDPGQREVDCRIGEAVAAAVWDHLHGVMHGEPSSPRGIGFTSGISPRVNRRPYRRAPALPRPVTGSEPLDAGGEGLDVTA